jgi:hypothetical protein
MYLSMAPPLGSGLEDQNMSLGNGIRPSLYPLKELDQKGIGPIEVSELEVKGIVIEERAAPLQRPHTILPAAGHWKCLVTTLRNGLRIGIDEAAAAISEGSVARDITIQTLCLRSRDAPMKSESIEHCVFLTGRRFTRPPGQEVDCTIGM